MQARQPLDNRYSAKTASEYSYLVEKIDIDNDISWLDFAMDDSKKKRLFIHGVESALEFLSGFEWEEYLKVRNA